MRRIRNIADGYITKSTSYEEFVRKVRTLKEYYWNNYYSYSWNERKSKLFMYNKYLIREHRIFAHCKADGQKVLFFDYYGTVTFITILIILLLSIADACFTLHLLSHGSEELNPIMAYFLRLGTTSFIVSKYLITSVSILGLLFIQHTFLFKIRLSTDILYLVIIFIFALTVSWEIFLVS